jgi:secondary thiamine-phosphate synthase enzyme
MAWLQQQLRLSPRRRGFHLITAEVEAALPELANFRVGILHVFLRHTSASLCLNENADPDVPPDLETAVNAIVPDDLPYRHTIEGPDDMPAHVKTALIGAALTVPIAAGRLCLGTWQGIYLCEHRDRGGPRQLMLTVHGETN